MDFRGEIKKLVKKYKHAWVFIYVPIYLIWFCILENRVTAQYHIIHSVLDDSIPFVEYFIVPYLLWFVFIAAVFLYFFFTDVEEFYKLSGLMFAGMTIFLIVSTIMPNGLELRPLIFERDNIFVDAVKLLYRTDTPTNVFPSIHVYNSVVACIAVSKSRHLEKKKGIRHGVYAMAVLIILSTDFLKQHSVIDLMAAFVMAYVLYPFVYAGADRKVPAGRGMMRRRLERKRQV